MPDSPLDWRTEIATQVCTLVRDDRAMARFRAMCVEFVEQKKRDEVVLAGWEQRRKEFCQRGLHTLDDFKARTAEMERLGNDRDAIEKTRPYEDTRKTLSYDYYQDHLSYEDAQRLGDPNATHMLVGFCVWIPPELSLAKSPELTVPDVLARFLGGMDLHSSRFGRFIEPGIGGWPEKYATLAVIHDAVFPERIPIDQTAASKRNAVFELPNESEASIREWLADVETDLANYFAVQGQLIQSPAEPAGQSKEYTVSRVVSISDRHDANGKNMSVRNVQPEIDLRQLLVRALETKIKRAENITARAASLVLSDPQATELSKLDRQTVKRFLANKIDVQLGISGGKDFKLTLEHDELKRLISPFHFNQAKKLIRSERARELGTHSGNPTAWELVLDKLIQAIANRQGFRPITGAYDDEIEKMCWTFKTGSEFYWRELVEHVDALQEDGFTEHLVKDLRDLCPGEAAEMQLPPLTKAEPLAKIELTEPMTRTELSRRIFGGKKNRPREVEPLLSLYGFELVPGTRKIRVRLENMDPNTRRKVENPVPS